MMQPASLILGTDFDIFPPEERGDIASGSHRHNSYTLSLHKQTRRTPVDSSAMGSVKAIRKVQYIKASFRGRRVRIGDRLRSNSIQR